MLVDQARGPTRLRGDFARWREFSPDYDRGGRFERLPTRDLLLTAACERFPDIFADEF